MCHVYYDVDKITLATKKMQDEDNINGEEFNKDGSAREKSKVNVFNTNGEITVQLNRAKRPVVKEVEDQSILRKGVCNMYMCDI